MKLMMLSYTVTKLLMNSTTTVTELLAAREVKVEASLD